MLSDKSDILGHTGPETSALMLDISGTLFAHFGFMGMFSLLANLGVVPPLIRIVVRQGAAACQSCRSRGGGVTAYALYELCVVHLLLTHGLIPAVVMVWLIMGRSRERRT